MIKSAEESKEAQGKEEVVWELSEKGPQFLWYRAQVTLASDSPFKVYFVWLSIKYSFEFSIIFRPSLENPLSL